MVLIRYDFLEHTVPGRLNISGDRGISRVKTREYDGRKLHANFFVREWGERVARNVPLQQTDPGTSCTADQV